MEYIIDLSKDGSAQALPFKLSSFPGGERNIRFEESAFTTFRSRKDTVTLRVGL